MTPFEIAGVAIAAAAAFTVSASAGLGGSLILVPALGLVLGTRQGVALAALLLACNNVVKVIAYRATVPFRVASWLVGATLLGAYIGARLLVSVSDTVVGVAVVISIVAAFAFDAALRRTAAARASAPLLALGSGMSSGFSGTSGPLKGVAIRGLGLDRLHFVGAASLVSLAGDALKAGIYTDAALLDAGSWAFAIALAPLMVLCTAAGRRLTSRLGEPAFFGLFWLVMTGYIARILTRWA